MPKFDDNGFIRDADPAEKWEKVTGAQSQSHGGSERLKVHILGRSPNGELLGIWMDDQQAMRLLDYLKQVQAKHGLPDNPAPEY